MTEVVDSVARVTSIMGEISSAGAQQSAGIEQINQAVTEMDAVTQQNAALVEEAAAAADALKQQAARLGRWSASSGSISWPCRRLPKSAHGLCWRWPAPRHGWRFRLYNRGTFYTLKVLQ
jgi:uncharacterized phage infection (PIP) family protein YhgE